MSTSKPYQRTTRQCLKRHSKPWGASCPWLGPRWTGLRSSTTRLAQSWSTTEPYIGSLLCSTFLVFVHTFILSAAFCPSICWTSFWYRACDYDGTHCRVSACRITLKCRSVPDVQSRMEGVGAPWSNGTFRSHWMGCCMSQRWLSTCCWSASLLPS